WSLPNGFKLTIHMFDQMENVVAVLCASVLKCAQREGNLSRVEAIQESEYFRFRTRQSAGCKIHPRTRTILAGETDKADVRLSDSIFTQDNFKWTAPDNHLINVYEIGNFGCRYYLGKPFLKCFCNRQALYIRPTEEDFHG